MNTGHDMASTTSLQGLKFDNSLGAMLIGVLVSTTLFGLTSLQTYLYYVNYAKDRAAFKWLVGVVWVLDFVHTIFICHSAYYFLVTQYGNPAALLMGEWSLFIEVGVTVPVTLLVQIFFAHRVYKLTNDNKWLSGPIVILSLSHAATGVVSTVQLFQLRAFSKVSEVMGILSATLIMMAVNDLFITTVLCLYLRRTKSSFSETRSAIRLLIVYTIETGLVTSLFVTVDAICILIMPNNWVYIGVTFCISKLYANSLLTILNSRRSLQSKENVSKLTAVSGKQLTSLRMHELSDMSKSPEFSPISPSAYPETNIRIPPSSNHDVYVV